jgi:hypothetical protein
VKRLRVQAADPYEGEAKIEICQVLEGEDFGSELTPELIEQEERLREQVASKSSAVGCSRQK